MLIIDTAVPRNAAEYGCINLRQTGGAILKLLEIKTKQHK